MRGERKVDRPPVTFPHMAMERKPNYLQAYRTNQLATCDVEYVESYGNTRVWVNYVVHHF